MRLCKTDAESHFQQLPEADLKLYKNLEIALSLLIYLTIMLVMVEGPAVGKAGNCLDWIARGLEINEIKGFG